MIVTGEVVNDEVVAVRLQQRGERMRGAVREAIERLTYKLARRVTSQKLSGQVLKRRTGTLARSVAASPMVVVVGDVIDGVVGTNVKYGRVHEYGFAGDVSVRAHLRTRLGKQHSVRAFTRKVKLPERSFLRSTLREMGPEARRDIERAIAEATP